MISSQQPACFTFSLIILYRLIYLHTSPTAEPLSPSPLAQKKRKKNPPPLRFSPEKQVSPNYLYLILITF